MRWSQRRKLGVTLRNLIRVTKELRAAGALEGLDNSEIAAKVLQEIIQDNPTAFGDPGFDFDSILQLIEKLLPLIMMIIEMFSKF
jgi:hypothetical protein